MTSPFMQLHTEGGEKTTNIHYLGICVVEDCRGVENEFIRRVLQSRRPRKDQAGTDDNGFHSQTPTPSQSLFYHCRGQPVVGKLPTKL